MTPRPEAPRLTPQERAILDDLREEVAALVERHMLAAFGIEVENAKDVAAARLEGLPAEDPDGWTTRDREAHRLRLRMTRVIHDTGGRV